MYPYVIIYTEFRSEGQDFSRVEMYTRQGELIQTAKYPKAERSEILRKYGTEYGYEVAHLGSDIGHPFPVWKHFAGPALTSSNAG